jgi:hypothetical protein
MDRLLFHQNENQAADPKHTACPYAQTTVAASVDMIADIPPLPLSPTVERSRNRMDITTMFYL